MDAEVSTCYILTNRWLFSMVLFNCKDSFYYILLLIYVTEIKGNSFTKRNHAKVSNNAFSENWGTPKGLF